MLQARSPAVHAVSVVGLEDWLELSRQIKSADVKWLEEVLSRADSDPWRQSLRVARKSRNRPALERLAREVNVSAQPPQVLILLDRALRDGGAKEGAVTFLKRAHQAFPGDFWINHDLGVALQDCQPPQYQEAIRFLTAAEALRPQSPGVRLSLGLALSKSGRSDEAIATFRQAIQLKPDYAAAHVNLGAAYMEKGQLDQALAVYRRAAEVMPDDLEVQWNLGVVQAGMGQVEEALAAYDRILALKPDFIETHFDPAVQLSLKNWHEQALAISRQSASPKPQNVPIPDGPK
jgi:Flp pilus assembly protein TadD